MESDLGKLFIGGISWDTDEERLREYFSKYGEVVEAVIMRDRATGRARGFGFIVFADFSVAERVIMEKHMIDGRTVEAKKAVPRDDQQALKRHSSPIHHMSPGHGGGKTKKIFVGGLPSNITEAEFKNYFDQFGTISDVVVMYDHNTQRPRGFGFITYDSEEAVDRVLHKTFHELNGKMVEVKRAVPKELSLTPNRSPVLGFGNYGGSIRPSANSHFNSLAPGYNVNSVGRFSPIGSGRTAFSGLGLSVNPELSLNPSYDGTTSTFLNAPGYGRILSNPYYNGSALPNRYSTPIGFNRPDPPSYNLSNRDFWANRTDSAGSGWNLGVSVGNTRGGSWGLSSVASDNDGYARNFGTSFGPSMSPFSGTNGFEGSVGELYRGSSGYSDSTWQQPLPPQSFNELERGSSRPFGYSIGNVSPDPPANGSESYTGSYSVGNRQTNRGIAT
ncbi:PREDICTED: heterogeneous nuclear ribonucleoprotein 1-like isoform X2 [Tarenaya hassleriana]|nr:PREDICTED: heterogeneous nuclear ribonucleoprotein 1-like isoform X2 [Tarenaya hassleriana]XP_010545266.1 PREDICTED: heterogeneous nuclear ribonucleoprotein 1-like isoform X2 [Tarenaya hassleriana]